MRQVYLLCFQLFISVTLFAQSNVKWDFTTASPSSGVPVSNVTISPVTSGNSYGTTTLLSTTSASSGYTGASGTSNAGVAARIGALNTATNGSAYFQFTITPATNYNATISNISFGTRSTGTGPTAYTIRTSRDGFASDITGGTGTIQNNSAWSLKTNTASISTSASAPITIRIYGYNGSGSPGSGTVNWRIDDLSFDITVTTTACSAPSNQPTALIFPTVSQTAISGSFTATAAVTDHYLVLRSTASSLTQQPTSGTSYTSGQTFGNATVVSAGSSTSFAASGLAANTIYYFFVYAYNQSTNCYNIVNPLTRSQRTNAAPSLTAGSLASFGNVCVNADGAFNSFIVNGNALDGTDVVVGPLDGYTFATTSSGVYSSTLTLSGYSGGALSQTVYTHFAPVSVATYNGVIPVAGGGATSITVTATGRGVNTPPAVVANAAGSVSAFEANITGTITTIGCTDVTAYGIEYSTVSGFANGAGTSVASSDLSSGSFSVVLANLSPGTTYYYKAYAVNAGGASYSVQNSFTTAAISEPTATAATGITHNTFTATWNAVPGATSYYVDVSESPTFGTIANASDLFISEYVEGNSNNKYIEIFNGTGAAVDLSDYELRLYSNGSSTPTETALLSGTLANLSTIVYQNGAATVYGGTATVLSNVINFNGDDAVALYKISTNSFVDIFGNIGNDPGSAWSESGLQTLDRTLRRKSTITGGVTANPGGTGPGRFLTLAAQWDQYSTDNVSGLGTHDYDASTPSYVPGYENVSINGTSLSVTGLTPGRTYYYRVRAVSGPSTSDHSNTVVVTTMATPLPVKLINLLVERKSNDHEIKWVVASEEHISSYVLQYSRDGHNYHDLGIVLPRNENLTNHTTYTYYNRNAASGAFYYRIKIVEAEKISYSPVRMIGRASDKSAITLYPTIATSKVNLASPHSANVQFSIRNAAGALLMQNVLPANTVMTIDISKYARGYYFVTMQQALGEVKTLRFSKQ